MLPYDVMPKSPDEALRRGRTIKSGYLLGANQPARRKQKREIWLRCRCVYESWLGHGFDSRQVHYTAVACVRRKCVGAVLTDRSDA